MPQFPGGTFPGGTKLAHQLDGDDKLLVGVDGVTADMDFDEAEKRFWPDIVEITGTTHTLQASDLGKILWCTNAAGCTITIDTIANLVKSAPFIVQADEAGGTVTVQSGTATLTGSPKTTEAGAADVYVYRSSASAWARMGGASASAGLPTITSAEAIDANTIVITFSEEITGDTGFSFTDTGSLTISSVSQTGANELTFTITETMTSGSDIGYAYTPGDIEDVDANPLAATSGSVTNSISGGGYDADAQAYWEAEELAASITIDSTNRDALSDLFTALKAAGVYTDITDMALGYGTGLKNGRNLSANFTTTNSPTIGATGYSFDGVNDYLNDLDETAVSFALYLRTNTTDKLLFGSLDAGTGTYFTAAYTGDMIFRIKASSDVSTANASPAASTYVITRRADTYNRVTKNGTQIYYNPETATSFSSYPMVLGARTNNGTISDFNACEIGVYIAGSAEWNDTEMTAVYNAINTFITATSRA